MTPRRKTPTVCVNVTMPPRKIACRAVPRLPTRYAATNVFPCPGDIACSAPRTKAMPTPMRAMRIGSSRWLRISDNRSPRTRFPDKNEPGVSRAGAAVDVESPGAGARPMPGVIRIAMVLRFGSGVSGSLGYLVSAALRSAVKELPSGNSKPGSAATTISFHPMRSP